MSRAQNQWSVVSGQCLSNKLGHDLLEALEAEEDLDPKEGKWFNDH
jgi:hypothetical protein